MNTKRLLAITLTLALTFALAFTLAACGGGETGNTTPDSTHTPTPADTPAPTPTPDATPDNGGNNGGESTPDNGSGNETPIGSSFFPGIDDSLLPDDIVKFMVGTLESASYQHEYTKYNSYDNAIYLTFVEVTEEDTEEMREHYASESNATDAVEEIERYLFDWGVIEVEKQPSGKLSVTIFFELLR